MDQQKNTNQNNIDHVVSFIKLLYKLDTKSKEKKYASQRNKVHKK